MNKLTKKEIKLIDETNHCHFCNEKFCYDKSDKKYKNYCKVRDHDYYIGKFGGVAHSICNIRAKIINDIPVISHNGSRYDYHFIIEGVVKKFTQEIGCIGEDSEKYKSLTVPIARREKWNGKIEEYNLKFIDSMKFIEGSLEGHVNNLSEIKKCEKENNEHLEQLKSLETCLNNYAELEKKERSQIISSMKEKMSLMNNLINKYPEQNEFTENLNTMLNTFITCVNDYDNLESSFVKTMRSNLKQLATHIHKVIEINSKLLQQDLIKKFPNTYLMYKKDMNKFMLMIRKGIYPYEYINSWGKLKEKTLPPIENFDNALTQ